MGSGGPQVHSRDGEQLLRDSAHPVRRLSVCLTVGWFGGSAARQLKVLRYPRSAAQTAQMYEPRKIHMPLLMFNAHSQGTVKWHRVTCRLLHTLRS